MIFFVQHNSRKRKNQIHQINPFLFNSTTEVTKETEVFVNSVFSVFMFILTTDFRNLTDKVPLCRGIRGSKLIPLICAICVPFSSLRASGAFPIPLLRELETELHTTIVACNGRD